jgi:hypothetical protein
MRSSGDLEEVKLLSSGRRDVGSGSFCLPEARLTRRSSIITTVQADSKRMKASMCKWVGVDPTLEFRGSLYRQIWNCGDVKWSQN